MKHVPIMFKPEMLEQILAGRKTQTRRPFKGTVPAAIASRRWDFGDLLWVKERTSEYPNKMFMPKKLARVWLEITSIVSAERLQDITEDGAKAEGFEWREEFQWAWENMYSKTPCRWHLNPWVWVIAFELAGPPDGFEMVTPMRGCVVRNKELWCKPTQN